MSYTPGGQSTTPRTGLEYAEGFFLAFGILWVGGALLIGSLVLMSGANAVTASSNQTPIAESNNTPTTEEVQTVDATAEEAPPGETPAQP